MDVEDGVHSRDLQDLVDRAFWHDEGQGYRPFTATAMASDQLSDPRGVDESDTAEIDHQAGRTDGLCRLKASSKMAGRRQIDLTGHNHGCNGGVNS